jgi:hypothetical protein
MERFADGIPRIGARRLDAAEQEAWRRRIDARVRRLRFYQLAARVVVGVAVLAVAAFVLLADDHGLSPLLKALAAVGMVALPGALVGIPLYLAWRTARTWRPILERALADVRAGEVEVFGGEGLLEVLPASHLVLRRQGAAPDDWCVAYVTDVASAGGGLEVPVPGLEDGIAEAAMTHRHMTREELDELARWPARLLRRGLALAAGAGLGAMHLGGLVERHGLGRRQPEPTLARVLVALAVAAVVLAWHVRRRQAFRRDLEVRRVVVMRPRDPAAAGVEVLEVLPITGETWSSDGVPDAWRTARW